MLMRFVPIVVSLRRTGELACDRLRRAVLHPSLVLKDPDDVVKASVDASFVDVQNMIKSYIDLTGDGDGSDGAAKTNGDAETKPTGAHGSAAYAEDVLATLGQEDADECPICMDVMQSPVLIPGCLHRGWVSPIMAPQKAHAWATDARTASRHSSSSALTKAKMEGVQHVRCLQSWFVILCACDGDVADLHPHVGERPVGGDTHRRVQGRRRQRLSDAAQKRLPLLDQARRAAPEPPYALLPHNTHPRTEPFCRCAPRVGSRLPRRRLLAVHDVPRPHPARARARAAPVVPVRRHDGPPPAHGGDRGLQGAPGEGGRRGRAEGAHRESEGGRGGAER